MRKYQLGFTVYELLMVIIVLGIIIGVGFTIYAGVHFLIKFW